MEIDTMYYEQIERISYRDSLRVLEGDIQHANALAESIPKAKGGSHLRMKLVYNNFAPLILFLLSWIDRSCTCLLPRYLNLFQVLIYKVHTDGRPKANTRGRKASIRDFYAVILPSLQQLQYNLVELNGAKDENLLFKDRVHKKRLEGETTSVEYAWRLARKWPCLLAVTQCALNAIANGAPDRSLARFAAVALDGSNRRIYGS